MTKARRNRKVRWDRITVTTLVIIAAFFGIRALIKLCKSETPEPETNAVAAYEGDTEIMPEDVAAMDPAPQYLCGIDVSKWNEVEDLETSDDFIICKASEGVGYEDPQFIRNIETAIENGKYVGAYHWARPDTNSAHDDAVNFVNTIKPYLGKVMIVLDWEQPGTVDQTDWAASWLWEVYSMTGVKPVIYMSSSVAANPSYDWSDGDYSVAKNFPLWVADYTTDTNGNHIISYDVSEHGWKTIMWQYTGDGVDRSWSKLTAKDWEEACISSLSYNPDSYSLSIE